MNPPESPIDRQAPHGAQMPELPADPASFALRIQEAMRRIGMDGPVHSEAAVAVLEAAAARAQDPMAAAALERWIGPNSPTLRALRLGQSDDEEMASDKAARAIALACRAHMPLPMLDWAHQQLTTELSGIGPFFLGLALVEAHAIETGALPAAFDRHGQPRSPWEALFLNFVGEFDRPMAREMCLEIRAWSDCPLPANLVDLFVLDGGLGALLGAIEALPEIALDPKLPRAIDALSDPFDDEGGLEAANAFADALALGMPIDELSPSDFGNPRIQSMLEAAALAEAANPPSPRAPKPRL